eukprot:GEMP01028193.1.p1 GENE.GEMP01028193.1~~GEMP01028193.1.p1  ORF type:complete len:448 (-),score=125.79 GEMP01028193.1:493-1836(-)
MPCRGPSKAEKRLQEQYDQLQVDYDRLENEYAQSKIKHEDDLRDLTDRLTKERRLEVEASQEKAANDLQVTLDRLTLLKEEEAKRTLEDRTASLNKELEFRMEVADEMKKEVEKLKAQLKSGEEAEQVEKLKQEVAKLEDVVGTLEVKLKRHKRDDDGNSDDGQKYWSRESYHKYAVVTPATETGEDKLQRLHQENDALREQIKYFMMNESNCAYVHQRANLEEIPGEIPCGLFLGMEDDDPVDTECEFVCAGHSRQELHLMRAPSPQARSTAAISCLRPSMRRSTRLYKGPKDSQVAKDSMTKNAEVQCDRPFLVPPRPYQPFFQPYHDFQVDASSPKTVQPIASSSPRGASLPPPPQPADGATAEPRPAHEQPYAYLPPRPQCVEDVSTIMKDYGTSPDQLWFYGGDVPFTMSVYQARMKIFDRMLELLQNSQGKDSTFDAYNMV